MSYMPSQGSNDIADVKMLPKLSAPGEWVQSVLPLHFIWDHNQSPLPSPGNRFLDT